MSSNLKNIKSLNGNFDYSEQLRRYYSNEMSSEERNALEQRALEDPFLKDAMDGYDSTPMSYQVFYTKNKKRLVQKRSHTLLIALGTLLALFGISSLLDIPQTESNLVKTTKVTSPSEITAKTSFLADNEFEVLPQEIEKLVVIPERELISVEEVAEHQIRAEVTKEKPDSPIEIQEEIEHEEDYTYEDEVWHKKGQNATETVYLYDLLVVDYRQIKRENEQILYKRYELSGTPANEEGIEQDSHTLIERDVQIPYHNYLRKSMSFFSSSQFKQALNRYLLILEQYPGDVNALFYGGLSYYNLGKFEKSTGFFDQLIASELPTFREDAMWYKAKSFYQLERIEELGTLLDEIISQGGFYTKEAIDLKKELK